MELNTLKKNEEFFKKEKEDNVLVAFLKMVFWYAVLYFFIGLFI